MAAILFLFLTLPACKDRASQARTARPEIRGVVVATLAPSMVEEVYETSGTVKARMTAVLASRVSGAIVRLHSREGDRVQAGQTLVTIDDRDARERLNAAESGHEEAVTARQAAEKQHDLARITAERYGNLYREKVVSEQEFDQIETRRKVAALDLERAALAVTRTKALLEEARIHCDYTRVRAPFSGIVTSRKLEQGDMATPGTPLLTVEDTSLFKIEAWVDEGLMSKIRKGMTVKIFFDTQGENAEGVLSRVVPAVDPTSRTFLVEAELRGKSLRSGLYGRLSLPVGTRQALVVPRSAVVEKGSLTGVYSVDSEGIVSYRLIRKGKESGQGIEVLSGLRPGEKIIVKGVEKASDGGILKDEYRGVKAP